MTKEGLQELIEVVTAGVGTGVLVARWAVVTVLLLVVLEKEVYGMLAKRSFEVF